MTFRAESEIEFRAADGRRRKARLNAWVGPREGLYRLFVTDKGSGLHLTLTTPDPSTTPTEVVP
ncbi:MAG: hypothetical protein RLY86_664 [Pseudomonadota bacterium]